MPSFQMTGDGTFKMIRDDEGPTKWVEEKGEAPPLPRDITPNVSPVNPIRAEVARKYDLSTEGQNSLYSTPTSYRNVPSDWQDEGSMPGWVGSYNNQARRALYGKPDIEIQQAYTFDDDNNPSPYGAMEPTLQHEHAHKWMDQNLDLGQKADWFMNWGKMPEAQEAWGEYADRLAGLGKPKFLAKAPQEAYGKLSESPWLIPQVDKNRFFSGLFNDKWE